jgi:PEP-CTERM motif
VRPLPYWSGSVFSPAPGNAWGFNASNGGQGSTPQTNSLFVVAVRPGDVPEPQTLALALLALGATVAARRRRAA